MPVTVNPPKTPVTEGSNGIAAATLPNVCKMPGPPAPFVPVPLPNIGKSGDSPKGYTTKVTIEGKNVAIQGATFNSMGDVASKGTGGGLVSANTHGITKFVGPGSMDVKFEGKNVQLLTDPMLNNCAGGGSPPNAATMLGVIQPGGMVVAVEADVCPICGKNHGPLQESELSKADAAVLATNFKAQTQATVARGLAMLPKKIKVYIAPSMLGVVHCKCGNKYADQSAMTTEEFGRAADAAGMKHLAAEVSYMDGGKELDEKYTDKMNAVRKHMDGRFGAAAVDGPWRKASELATASLAGGPTAYPPGTCAAQGAFMVMLEDGHQIATAMTEEWFHPAEKPTAAMVDFWDERDGARKFASEKFSHGSTVPPCRACEVLVPMLFCSDEASACPR